MSFCISDYFTDHEIQLISGEAIQAEKLGRWTKAMIDLAEDKQLFHLFVPEAYGGKQLALPQAMEWLEAASRLDGSFGWTLTLGAGAGVFGAFMDPDFAKDVFADPKAFIAGSGFPGGTAQKNNTSYTINGQWKYASGFDHATLITASCIISQNNNGDGTGKTKAIACYPREVDVSSPWKSYGLKATGSHNFEINNITIPERRTFEINPALAQIEDILYQYPFVPFAQFTLAVSLIGIGGGFVSEAQAILKDKHNINVLTELPSQIHSKFISAKKKFKKARTQLYKSARLSWKKLKKEGKEINKKSLLADSSNITRQSCQQTIASVQQIYPLLGMAAIDPQSSVNRFWRDLHTASQHMLLTPVYSQ